MVSRPGIAIARTGERALLARDDERPDAPAERRAAPQQAVALPDPGDRAEAELRQVELARRARAGSAPRCRAARARHGNGASRARARARGTRTCRSGRARTRRSAYAERQLLDNGGTICAEAGQRVVDPPQARSDSAGLFEIVRTSTAGTPASSAARSTEKPSIASTSHCTAAADPRAARDRQQLRVRQRPHSGLDELRRRVHALDLRHQRGRVDDVRVERLGADHGRQGLELRAPAIPTWSTASGRSSASAIAVLTPDSAGPMPQQRVSAAPVASSSRSVAATTSINFCRRTSARAGRAPPPA